MQALGRRACADQEGRQPVVVASRGLGSVTRGPRRLRSCHQQRHHQAQGARRGCPQEQKKSFASVNAVPRLSSTLPDGAVDFVIALARVTAFVAATDVMRVRALSMSVEGAAPEWRAALKNGHRPTVKCGCERRTGNFAGVLRHVPAAR